MSDSLLDAAGSLVLDELNAGESRRVAGNLGIELFEHKVVLGRDLVLGTDDLIALGGVAGVGIGTVLGLVEGARDERALPADGVGSVRGA